MSEQLQSPSPLIPIPRAPVPEIPTAGARREIEITIDGKPMSVPEGATILDAARKLGIETPTLCFLETLTPVNVCRVCVVELEGSRSLVPACSRKVEPGMVIRTDSERVRLSRRVVLEFLASSVDVSTAPELRNYMKRYGARAEKFGPRAATVTQPPKIDNERARLRKVHPLLQMRGSLRRGCAEHVRDWRGGTRVPRAHCHGI